MGLNSNQIQIKYKSTNDWNNVQKILSVFNITANIFMEKLKVCKLYFHKSFCYVLITYIILCSYYLLSMLLILFQIYHNYHCYCY